MQHTSDCSHHDEPAYKRGPCNCGLASSIERCLQSAMLTQSLIEAGPADVTMTEATMHLTAARDALRTALGKSRE